MLQSILWVEQGPWLLWEDFLLLDVLGNMKIWNFSTIIDITKSDHKKIYSINIIFSRYCYLQEKERKIVKNYWWRMGALSDLEHQYWIKWTAFWVVFFQLRSKSPVWKNRGNLNQLIVAITAKQKNNCNMIG